MTIKRKIMTGVRNQLFTEGGRGHVILTGKIRAEENRITQKREANTLKDCLLIFSDGMSRAERMKGSERIDYLRQLHRKIIDVGVNPNYDPKARKQSWVHEQTEKMALDVAREIVKTKR